MLRLLAAGHSNREIAAELFIAPKTASVHVSNILGKLGAASRTEAAAIAHSNGLRGELRPGQPGEPGGSAQAPGARASRISPARAVAAAGSASGRADQRIPVQVVEHLGDALLGQALRVLADLRVAARQQQPPPVRSGPLGPGPDHARGR